MSFEESINQLLEARKQRQEYRQLSLKDAPIDFTSNDYLGLSRSAWIKNKVEQSAKKSDTKSGSTGSRLLSGNSKLFESLESKIADFHNAESALIFNSGFDANLGVISTLVRGENVVVIYDELVHASIHQGIKLCGVKKSVFQHNDIDDLESVLEQNKSKICFIIVESFYSMNGDKAPLKNIVALKNKFKFELIVDEAHALGIFGKQGRGLCNEEGIEEECLARVYTFGKALGAHGAVVVGSEILKNYLINFCKPFIYSTALSSHLLLTVEHSYKFIQINDYQLNELNSLICHFKFAFESDKLLELLGEGPIFGIKIGNPDKTRKLSKYLNEQGFYIRPIVYPTVARGSERLRICLHAYNTKSEIDRLFKSIKAFKL